MAGYDNNANFERVLAVIERKLDFQAEEFQVKLRFLIYMIVCQAKDCGILNRGTNTVSITVLI